MVTRRQHWHDLQSLHGVHACRHSPKRHVFVVCPISLRTEGDKESRVLQSLFREVLHHAHDAGVGVVVQDAEVFLREPAAVINSRLAILAFEETEIRISILVVTNERVSGGGVRT